MKYNYCRTWSDEDLKEAVKNSKNYSEVLGFLKLKSGSRIKIKREIKNQNLDISHFSKICNRKGGPQYSYSIEDILNNKTPLSTSAVKERLLKVKLLEYKCYICNISEWQNKKLMLQLDHINGNNENNELNNLRLLCPNCHSQTDTYAGKNIKEKRQKRDKYNCDKCKKEISTGSKYCKSCAPNRLININWPSDEELIKQVKTYGPLELSRKMNISRHTLYTRLIYIGYYILNKV